MDPNLKGLILEGIAGAGKTSVLRGLQAHPTWTGRPQISAMILSEHQTMRVLESKRDEGKLTRQHHIDLLDDIVGMLEVFNHRLEGMDWARRNRNNHQMHFVLERFHFSHLIHYGGLDWEDVAGIDQRLANINARLCILTIDEDAMLRRITGDGTKQWQGYLDRIGRTETEIIAHFSRQQERLLSLYRQTVLRVHMIDTAAAPIEAVVNEVAGYFLGDTT